MPQAVAERIRFRVLKILDVAQSAEPVFLLVFGAVLQVASTAGITSPMPPAIHIRRLSLEGSSAGPCANVPPRAAATARQRAAPGVLSLTLIGRLTSPAISTEDRWSGGPASSKDSIWAASCSNDS